MSLLNYGIVQWVLGELKSGCHGWGGGDRISLGCPKTFELFIYYQINEMYTSNGAILDIMRSGQVGNGAGFKRAYKKTRTE